MRKIIPVKKIFLSALFLAMTFLFFPSSVFAGWYFNWSCWRSSGREGPYPTRGACESELSRARNACAGGSKFSSSGCSGFDDYRPGSSLGSGSRPGSGPGPAPQRPPGGGSGEVQIYHPTQEEERKLREAAEEQNRREREATRKFIEDKEQALQSLKGGSDTLTIKGGTDIFGIKGSPEVTLKKPEGEPVQVTGAWRQLHCAGYISGFALKAAYPKDRREVDIEEVHYLAEQAMNALSGAPVEVECPQAPPPPRPYGQEKLSPTSAEVKFYQTLLRATEKQGERINRAEKQIIQATAKKQELQSEIKEKREKVARLKEELKTLETTRKPTEPTQDKKAEGEKKGAREAALAALRAAEAALAGVKKTETDADKQSNAAERDKADANARLGEYEKMFNEIRADPGKASEWLSKIKQ